MSGAAESEAPTKRGLLALVPNLQMYATYERGWIRGDLLAGLTVAAYLVPQVMAYATIAGLPPVVGLWAILPALVAYAIFGSSRQLSVGPESTTALMTAAVVGPLAHGDPTRYAVLAAALAVVVGIICLVCWFAQLGFIANLLSMPVLVGYMAGIAILMIGGQLDKLTGVPIEGEGFLNEMGSFVTNITHVHWPTLFFGIALLALLLLISWRFEKVPGPLLVVVAATAITAAAGLQAYGIEVIGTVPVGLPRPAIPAFGEYAALIFPAVGVVLVGYTDNVLTARSFANRNGYRVDPNQEFLALGAANIGAGVMHGFPVSSSASRTALGDAAGSKSQIYSMVAMLCTLAVLLFLGPVLADFPKVALGAIVAYAALRLIDVAGFRRLARFRRSEFILAIAAFAGVLVLGILYGILLAVGLSIADLLRRTGSPHDAVLGLVPGLAGMHDIADFPDARTVPGLMIYRYDSPLFFANAENFRNRALLAVETSPDPVRWFIVNAEANVEVDITGLDALDELRKTLVERGVIFGMVRVTHEVGADLETFGLTESIGEEHFFPTMPTAVAAYREWAQQYPA